MEQRIRDKFSETVLAEALRRYGVTGENVRLLDGFESFIYEYERDGGSFILRLSHSYRRTADTIRGELDWINYLADRGVATCRGIPSLNGELVEEIPVDDTHFSAVSFVKAPGTPANKDTWNDDLFGEMGRMMGRMHALSREYALPNDTWKRPEWYEEVEGSAEKYLPAEDRGVAERFNHLLQYLRALPRNRDSYGLVHIDFHQGNFFVSEDRVEGRIHRFDFDDCQYCWYAADIAIALFYAVPHHCDRPQDLEFARRFYSTFMEGYVGENALDPFFLKQIPHFLKQREIDLYIIIHRSLDLDDLDPWCASYMDNRRQKILADLPYVDIPFV